MHSQGGILRVVRTSQFVNRGRRIAVYVDGGEVGTVRNGETLEFGVDAGDHDVHAEVDWVRSETLHVTCAPGVPTTLRLSSPLTGWKLFRIQQAMSGPPGSFITLEVLAEPRSDPR
jgi:hypothetical protein